MGVGLWRCLSCRRRLPSWRSSTAIDRHRRTATALHSRLRSARTAHRRQWEDVACQRATARIASIACHRRMVHHRRRVRLRSLALSRHQAPGVGISAHRVARSYNGLPRFATTRTTSGARGRPRRRLRVPRPCIALRYHHTLRRPSTRRGSRGLSPRQGSKTSADHHRARGGRRSSHDSEPVLADPTLPLPLIAHRPSD